MSGAERYNQLVNRVWPKDMPAITRDEAARAARLLYRKFGKRKFSTVSNGRHVMSRDAIFQGTIRRCWISLKPPNYHDKGWARLVHDLSHRIHYMRAPKLGNHAGGHAYLECEMTNYVLDQGWLDGKLKPKAKPKLSVDERRVAKRGRLKLRLALWESKARRAQTAIKKLRRALRTAEQRSDV